MSSGKVSKAGLSRMHEVMAGYVSRGEIPGLVTLVNQGVAVHVDAVGTLATGSNSRVERDTIFRIASLSKPITAAATMILVEDCRVRLDEPVDRLLPELANRKVLNRVDGPLDDTVPAKRPITVRDLLTFTCGFGVPYAPPDAYPILKAARELEIGVGPPQPLKTPPPDEWIRRLGTLPLMCQPGEMWLYNTGSDVLSVLIARASGKPFETFLRERVFEPLGMKDTSFSVPTQKLNRFATAYSNNFKTGKMEVYDEAATGQWAQAPPFASGAGGLVSTADDYFAFSRTMLNKGKFNQVRILSSASVETMLTDQLTAQQKAVSGLLPGYFDSRGWGFGISVITRRVSPAEPVGMYGWNGGLGTLWNADPEKDLCSILLTQRAWSSPRPPDVCEDFGMMVYRSLDD